MDILPGFLYKQLQTVGKRLTLLRIALDMSREDFAKKHGFSKNTLRAIESDKLSLTSKQLHKLLKVFEIEGLICSQEWVTQGTGPLPILAEETINRELQAIEEQYNSSSIEVNPALIEAALFQKHHPGSLITRITDDSMNPIYEEGDYVGGVKISCPLMESSYNTPCILKLMDDREVIRIVYPGTEENLFTLGSPAPFYLINTPLLVNIPLKEIYQIIWHRKNR